MELYKGYLFNGRYRLVSRLGEGASAEVWQAIDTKVGNLNVALKIRLNADELDTIGIHNFEQEFVSAFNMKHTNLLTPTGYDICNGQPFLIMPYCANGSCEIMCGEINETELLALLRDVSAGLEYLHSAGIIHQDIKPANILIDDNMSYLVTDFGISTFAEHNDGGMVNCTPAYAAPERFNGISLPASDMWALGASAIELLTGDLPYGEHGGLLQASEPLPDLPNISPELKALIYDCMIQDPERRITAGELHHRIAHYLETGSWTMKSRNHTLTYVAAAVVALFVCGGIFLWDANRTKVRFYDDYAEIFGIPQGIGRVSSSEQQHRGQTYRFEYRKYKLRRVALVNYKGKLINHTDTEHINSRYSDVRYYYTAGGKLDYKAIYNSSGGMLYKMDYDEKLHTVTFRQNDEFGTEYNLMASTTDLHHQASVFEDRSPISRFLLKYDKNGHLLESRYAGLQNAIVHDADNIFGMRYTYDVKGRIVEIQYIDASGDPTSNHIGLSKKKYTYNNEDRWESVSYYGINGEPSHDGQNCHLVELAYDKYGNRCSERYYGPEGERAYRTDVSTSGYSYSRDEHGLITKQTFIDADDKPILGDAGYSTVCFKYDDNGFVSELSLFDADSNLTLGKLDGFSVAHVVVNCDEYGKETSRCYYDEYERPIDDLGYFMVKNTYDSLGNSISLAYYDVDGNPTVNLTNVHKIISTYNDLNQLTQVCCYDVNEQPTPISYGWTIMKIERNRQGAPLRTDYLGNNGVPIMTTWRYSARIDEYDDLGNLIAERYLNERGHPCITEDGYASIVIEYDKNNFITSRKQLNIEGKLIKDQRYEYDGHGNITREWTVGPAGSLIKGTAVEVTEYNSLNEPTRIYTTNLAGNRIKTPGFSFAEMRNVYDNRGNIIVCTYWDVNGQPATDNLRVHRREHEFDNMNRVVHEKNYGVDGKPISGTNVNPEGRVKYDRMGHLVEISCYDGYGNPRLSADGFFRQAMEYNKYNQVIEIAYYDTKNNLVLSNSGEYARCTKEYNHGNLIVADRYYDASNRLYRIERYHYNNRRRQTEWIVLDGSLKPNDSHYGFSKRTTDYSADSITPTKRHYYSASGQLLATQTYNSSKNSWNDIQMIRSVNIRGNWQNNLAELAAECPIEMEDGVILQSITLLSAEVVFTLKITSVSEIDFTDELREQFTDLLRAQVKPGLRKLIGIPQNIQITLKVLDKKGYLIGTC